MTRHIELGELKPSDIIIKIVKMTTQHSKQQNSRKSEQWRSFLEKWGNYKTRSNEAWKISKPFKGMKHMAFIHGWWSCGV